MTRGTTPEPKQRQSKTPRQRAEEALALCERKIARVEAKVAKLTDEAGDLRDRELHPLLQELQYLQKHPALQDGPASDDTHEPGRDDTFSDGAT